jgi:hypothetical protein
LPQLAGFTSLGRDAESSVVIQHPAFLLNSYPAHNAVANDSSAKTAKYQRYTVAVE